MQDSEHQEEIQISGTDDPLGLADLGTNFFLQCFSAANTGFMIYMLVDLGCSTSQQEKNAHCWHNSSLTI